MAPDRGIGAAGGRMHLGRSRNDQVLTALRLYLRDAIDAARRRRARSDRRSRSPGRARGQTAAARLHPHAAGHAQFGGAVGGRLCGELRDDAAGLAGVRRRMDKSPLGSAAGYGTPGLPLDRDATARALGFESVQEPVTAVQLSRGKAESQLLFEITLLMQDLGRFAADPLLFYTQEFAFSSCPTPSPPAPRSCRRSATRTSSSWSRPQRQRAGLR